MKNPRKDKVLSNFYIKKNNLHDLQKSFICYNQGSHTLREFKENQGIFKYKKSQETQGILIFFKTQGN